MFLSILESMLEFTLESILASSGNRSTEIEKAAGPVLNKSRTTFVRQ
jgi:hypothetical protein